MKVRKAIIPAAGLGTRLLPNTKSIPKEMLPLVDKPVLQYIVEEAVAAGVEQILIITNRGKSPIEDYFDYAPDLEDRLLRDGKEKEARVIREVADMADVLFLRQKETKGLGHAVWRARSFVGNEPFAVLLGDDIMLGEKPVLKQLVEASEENSCSAVAIHEVPDELIVKYSSVRMTEQLSERVWRITDMNEKPTLEEKFSNYAILGRYVLTPAIFDILEKTPPGRNNEIQLTDGILYAMRMAERGFVALAFDPSYTGESSGEPRRTASPDINTEDFMAAVDFLSKQENVDANRIGIIGICGWGGIALNAAAADVRIKATVASTMYDMTRVSGNGYFDADDNEESRHAAREAMARQRLADPMAMAGGVVNPLPDDAPQFVKDYYDYYITPRGYHKRSGNSNDGWRTIGTQAFANSRFLYYINEIRSAVLVMHGEKAHSRYFGEAAYKYMVEGKAEG